MTALDVDPELLEREVALARLGAVVAGVLDGRGAIVVAHGPAGIGKTTLLNVTRDVAVSAGCRVLSARGSDFERPFSYAVVRQLLEPAAVATPTRTILPELFGRLRRLAHEQPLVLLVDDADSADGPSLEFLGFAARRLTTLPVVIVLAAGRGGPGMGADLVRAMMTDSAFVLDLEPLSAAATAALVRSMLGSTAGDDVCAACYGATGGNPFLVHELALALGVEGAARPDAADAVARLVPDSVARYVTIRLSLLGTGAVAVARALAVLGPDAELRHVAALAELDADEAAAAVDRLAATGVLTDGEVLGFAHPILLEAIRSGVLPGARRLAHAHAAKLLAADRSSADRVARHLVAAEPTGASWAVDTLRQAAADANARGAPGTAAVYLARAVDELPWGGAQFDLLFDLGVAEVRAALPSAARHLGRAWELTDDKRVRARIAAELAAFNYTRGGFDQSSRLVAEAIDGLEDYAGGTDEQLRYRLEAERAVLAVSVPEMRRTLTPTLASLRARAVELVDTPGAAPLLAVLAAELTETDGTAADAVKLAQRAFEDGRLLAEGGSIVAVGAAALVNADRPRLADEILDRVVAEARARGSIPALRTALASRAYARNRLGRIADAEADARRSLELPADVPFDVERPFRTAQLAEALIEAGRLDEARSVVTAAALEGGDQNSKLYQPLRDAHARLLLLEGRVRDALRVIEATLSWQQRWGCRNPGWVSARVLGATAYRALGQGGAARTLADDDLAAATAYGAARTLGIALRTRALVEDAPSIELLRESATVLEQSEAPVELARTLVELGSACRREGGRRACRTPLQQALEIAEECGAEPVGRAARVELAASGTRPRPRRCSGSETLTASERRVAHMAERGLSNREIAQSLFLSPKTVEMHLGHAYRKLGIRSRVSLVAALAVAEGR